jgi:hypothetical protein
MTAAINIPVWKVAHRARTIESFKARRSPHLARVALRRQLARAGEEISLTEIRQWPRVLQAAAYLWAWNVENGLPATVKPWTVATDEWKKP